MYSSDTVWIYEVFITMRNYIRKTQKGIFCRQDMLAAVDDVLNNNLSLRKAAATYNVNYRTLSRYVNAKKNEGTPGAKDLNVPTSFGYQQPGLVFPKNIEEQLIEYSITASRIYHSLTLLEL